MHPLLAHIERFGFERCLILVPRQTAARALMSELTSDGSPIFGLRIETPATLIDRLTPQVPGLRPLLGDSSTEAIIGELARQIQKPAPSPLMNLLARASGQRVALSTMKELRFNGYKPEHLSDSGAPTLQEIAEVMRRYDEFCRRNDVMDWPTRQLAVIQALESGKAKYNEFDCLFVSGFSVIQHHIRRLILALAKGRETILNIPLDRERESLFADGIALADSLASAMEIEDGPSGIDEPLSAFKRAMFASKRIRVPVAAEVVSFHSVPSRFDEVETAAIKIDRLLSEGVAPSAIGLTTRSLPEYDRYISAVFRKFNIPYFYRRGMPMLHSPVIRMAMKLTELGEDTVRFDALLGVLRSRFMPFGAATTLREHILNGEVHTETPEGWLRIVERVAESDEHSRAFHKLLASCVSLHQRDGKRGTAKSFLGDFRQIVDGYICKALDLLDGSNDASIQQHAKVFRDHINSFMELIKIIDGEISQLRGWGIEDIDPLQVLRDRISKETIIESHPPQESVHVFNFFDMGYQHVDHLFVIGMDEHSVPRPTTGTGLLGDEELAALEKIRAGAPDDFGRINDAVARRRGEEQAFVLAINSAKKSIDLFAPSRDGEGKELVASPYFSEAMWIAGVEKPNDEPGGDLRSLDKVQPDRYSIRRQVLRHLYRTDIDVKEMAAESRALFSRMFEIEAERKFSEQIGNVLAIEERRRSSLFSNRADGFDKWTGRFEDPRLLQEIADTFNEEYSWSATALQAYAISPFSFFIQKVLRLNELNTPIEEGDPRRLGSLYHDILQQFVDETAEHFPLKEFSEAEESIKRSIASAFERLFGSADPVDLGLLRRLHHEQATAVMRGFLNLEMQHLENRPIRDQLEFSFEGNDCVIELPNMNIRLEGRFDRVDRLESDSSIKMEIIDYKKRLSALGKPTPAQLDKGRNLQIPIYLLAASKLFGVELDSLRGRLLGLENKTEYSVDMSQKKIREFMGLEPGAEKTIYDLIQEYVTNIRRGDFRLDGVLEGRDNLVGRWLELPPEMVE